MSRKMPRKEIDITGKVGSIHQETEWPMYSYERPAYMLWNAIADVLINDKGWSEDQVKEWLQSKETRWALDSELGVMINQVGASFAAKMPSKKLKAA